MANKSKHQVVNTINHVDVASSGRERINGLDELCERIQVLQSEKSELELREHDLTDQLIAQSESISVLQIQCDEFRALYNEQRSKDTRYRELFDLAPVGYVSLKSDGIIDNVNLAAIHLMQVSGSRLINTPFSACLSAEDQLRLREHLISVSDSHLSQTWVADIKLPNGDIRPVQLVTSAIRSRKSQETSYQVMIVDISQQLNNEKLLRNAKDFLEEMAHHDPLTKLPNRTLFRDNLQALISHRSQANGKVGIIYFDLDGFKPINDSLGHSAGDTVLKEVAARVTSLLRTGDSMARLGGDEFTVLMDNPAGTEDIVAYAESIARQIREPFEFGDSMASVSSSIGISLYPDHALKIDDLVKGADAAMYQAKKAGRDRVVMFTRESLEVSDRQSMLETSLVHAIRDDQLSLHYQPIYDIASLKVISVEALLRWQHPTLGAVAPSEFIPLAEKTDQIISIGQWVLDTACHQARAWNLMGIHVPIAINVSSRQLIRQDYAMRVRDTLARHELPPIAIEIEITETAIMIDHAQCRQSLQALKSKGHVLSIDDFGTGHSSLGRLAHLPVSRLKIDRMFIGEMESSVHMKPLIKSIIVMAHELGLQVVSEGIECQEQLEFLEQHHCDAIQGFMMSRAEPAESITALLAFDAGLDARPYQGLTDPYHQSTSSNTHET